MSDSTADIIDVKVAVDLQVVCIEMEVRENDRSNSVVTFLWV